MSGNIVEKSSAVFFAAVMVISMVAIGGFAGTAAAANNDGLSSVNSVTAPDIEPEQNDVAVTYDVQYTHETNGDEEDISVDLSQTVDGAASIDSVSNLRLTSGDTGEVTVGSLTSSGSPTDTVTFTSTDDAGAANDQVTVSFDVTYDTTGQATEGSGTNTITASDQSATHQTATDTSGFVDSQITFNSAQTNNADSSGQVDEIQLTFSEEVDDTATGLDTSLITSIGTGSVDSVSTGASANDEQLVVGVSGVGGTGSNPTITVDQSAIVDKSGTTGVGTRQQTAIDALAPFITSARQSAASEITVTFSEEVEDGGDGGLDASDLTFVDNNGQRATSITGATFSADSTSGTFSTDSDIASDDINTDQIEVNTGDVDPVESGSNTGTPDQAALQSTTLLQNPSGFDLQGDSNNEISTDIGGSATQNLRAGSAAQELDLIRVRDVSGGGSPLSARTIFEMPDGVTINESATDLLVTTTSGNLDITITGSQIVDENTLRINHSGSSVNGEILRVSGVSVDVASDVPASQGGVASDINVDFATGNLDTALVTAEKPQIQTGATQDISAGGNDQDATSLSPIVVQTGTNVDGQIANQTDIVINANASNGVTFNTDTDPTTLTTVTTGNAEVDISSATLTEDALTIPVTAHFDAGDSVSIDATAGDTLDVDATGNAEDAKLSATVVANGTTGDVTTQSSSNNPDINIQKPEIDIGNGDANDPAGQAVIGASATDTNDNFVNIVGGAADRIDVNFQTNNPLRSGSDIVIQTNRSDVTFVTGASTGTTVANNDDQTFDAEVTTGVPSVTNINININQNEIVVTLNNPQNIGNNDVLSLNELPVSVASSVPDETSVAVGIVVETSPSSGTTVTTTSNNTDPENDFLELERPDVLLNNDNNATVDIDADGESQFVDPDIAANNAGAETDNALVIDAEDVNDQIDTDTTVSVELEDNTGVTFDQSVTATNDGTTGLSNGDDGTTSIDAEFATVSNVQYSQGQLSFDVDAVSQTGAGEITIDQLFLNVTSGASNADVTVTTTTVSGNDVTTNANTIVESNEVNPSNVFADANVGEDPADADVGPNRDGSNGGDFGGIGTGEAVDDSTTDDNPTVDETITGSVFIQDGAAGNAFGGASVNLELAQQPDGSEGASFNTTALTTNSNGLANYEFTIGDTDGTYVINASTDSGSTNITYEAVPGQAADVTVTPIENAIAGDGTEIGQAAFFVNATDANGNSIQATPTVSLTADNVGTTEVAEFSDASPAGSRASVNAAGETGDLSDGDAQFDIDADGSSVVEVNTDTVQNVTLTVTLNQNSDSGTVRFFENVGQVDLTLSHCRYILVLYLNAI